VSPSSTEAPRHLPIEVLLCTATALSWLDRMRGEHLAWSIWSDRDLVRAAVPWSELPTAGAELSFGTGARVPGGALAALIKLAQLVHDDPVAVFRWMHLLDGIGLLVLYLGARRLFGPLAAAIAAATVAGSEVVSEDLLRLWNPGFVPLFATIATVSAALAAHRQDARWLPLMTLALAVGCQLHLSVGLLTLGLVLGVATSGPRPRSAWALAAVALVIPYLQHLIDEASNGWPNTLAMRQQPLIREVTAPAPPVEGSWWDAWWFVRRLGAARAPAAARDHGADLVATVDAALAVWPVLVAGMLALVVARRAADDPRRRVDRALLITLLLGWLGYLRDDTVTLHDAWSTRYLQAFLPAWGLCAGAACAGFVARLPKPWQEPTSTLFAAPLVFAVGLGIVSTHEHERGERSYRHLVADVAAIRQHTGWSTREVIGRLALAVEEDGRWMWESGIGFDELLRADGQTFAGSLPGPCAVWFPSNSRAPEGWPDEDAVRAVFRQDLPGLRIVERPPVAHGHLLLYTWDGTCHTTFTDRYLPTPTERLLLDVWPTLERLKPTRIEAPDGVQRWAVRLGGGEADRMRPDDAQWSALVLALDLVVRDGQIEATLHSNQLRGQAYNKLWFADYTVGHPRLRLRSTTGEEVELPLAADLVGRWGVLTPTSRRLALPAGEWQTTLLLEVVEVPHGWREPYDAAPRHPVEVVLPAPVRL
jgi:hypothetical protein